MINKKGEIVMRKMRVVSMLLVVAMLGTTVVPTYGEEIGTPADEDL